jgi:hypothetical protein
VAHLDNNALDGQNPSPVKAQPNPYVGSDSMVDLPLREPLDTELRLNRNLAKQIYNKEKNMVV